MAQGVGHDVCGEQGEGQGLGKGTGPSVPLWTWETGDRPFKGADAAASLVFRRLCLQVVKPASWWDHVVCYWGGP